ncbi:hypothetical protein RHGRI_016365 [Rhododendron griersonianum]|uniref:Transposase MuDR plant domain-containing protein n=1 Tax=Rhododendron griersonianum TaxID=479676 RepID=A0AAV6JTV8_9ERIC|nr:hypothetical protein RHGRI_016365 [Rhododendron griersonianum]
MSLDTWGLNTTRGRKGDLQPRDQHYFERKLTYLAEKHLKKDIRKVAEEFSWYSKEGQWKLVRRQQSCGLKECHWALDIERDDAVYSCLRAEALAPPQPSYRFRTPDSVGSYVAGPSSPPDLPGQTYPPPVLAPPVYIDISSDSEEEDPEELPMDNSD